MRRLLAVPVLCLAAVAWGGVASTTHNLSVNGPGAIRATTETEICVFCHTPHNASPAAPLWNHRGSSATYTLYTSTTNLGGPGQPTGASMLCLSCHDGTIALGDVLSETTPITMSGGVTKMPAGTSNLGTDLSDDHPVSFAYTQDLANRRGDLLSPSTLTGTVRLDSNGQMQCTACHDPHSNTLGDYLTKTTQASALCLACHTEANWTTASHKTSTRVWNGASTDPFPHTTWLTVADNACESCHRPHTAGGHARTLNQQLEENNCYPCHNGNVAVKNVQTEFTKTSIHPIVTTNGVHDPTEAAVAQTRHVECVDCHNPHASQATATGSLPGSLRSVRGVNAAGVEVAAASFEYEICYRCHGDSPNKPASRTTRQIVQTNSRLEFALGNPSYHPIVGAGVNTNVPSLLPPWTVTSVMKCIDCHNANDAPPVNGTGPNGSHGSTYAPVLVKQYLTADGTTESSSAYALCYTCHSRTSILGDVSFHEHSKHISGERTPCNVCHDPHGVSATQGNTTYNSKLINFDTKVVSPSSSGVLRFENRGTNHGACFLRCHGVNHNPYTY